MNGTAPTHARLQAPAHWRSVDLVSDIHLHDLGDANGRAWLAWLRGSNADALMMLGDVFDVWVGDDVAGHPGMEADAVRALRERASVKPVWLMRGNRDFLMGTRDASAFGAAFLSDPCLFEMGGHSWLLSHGDALCLADAPYMQFREQVRRADWQDAFLSKPLPERQALAQEMRRASQAAQTMRALHADADSALSRSWLAQHGASALIHGHTHRPASHPLPNGQWRHVLADWRFDSDAQRAVVLRVHASGACERLSLAQSLGTDPLPPVEG